MSLTTRENIVSHSNSCSMFSLLLATCFDQPVYFFILVDLKKLYFMAGVDYKPTIFLFNDTQVLDESFLEDINNILSSGEVPNLYKPDEFEEVSTIDELSFTRWHAYSLLLIFVLNLFSTSFKSIYCLLLSRYEPLSLTQQRMMVLQILQSRCFLISLKEYEVIYTLFYV